MNKLISAAVAFALLIIGIGAAAVIRNSQTEDRSGEYAVRLNEIEKLAERGDTDEAISCAASLREDIMSAGTEADNRTVFLMGGACLVFLAGMVIYCRFVIIAPFNRLSDFAEKVACEQLGAWLAEQSKDGWSFATKLRAHIVGEASAHGPAPVYEPLLFVFRKPAP